MKCVLVTSHVPAGVHSSKLRQSTNIVPGSPRFVARKTKDRGYRSHKFCKWQHSSALDLSPQRKQGNSVEISLLALRAPIHFYRKNGTLPKSGEGLLCC